MTEFMVSLKLRKTRRERRRLRTQNRWLGPVRAGKGILVSAQNQDAGGKVLDMDDAISQLEQALSLAKSLNKAAQTANNHNTDEETQRSRLKDALKDLKEASLIQTAPAGIATATQQSQLHTANENIHLVSGNHTDITASQSLTAHAAESVNLFAQSSGIKVQANQGAVTVQAQNDELQLNALKDATLTSSAGKVTIAAKEEILITCKGAYIKLSNGEVEIGSPKVVRVRAPLVVGGANRISNLLPLLPSNQNKKENTSIQIKRIGIKKLSGISLDYKLKNSDDKTIFSSTTRHESGLSNVYDRSKFDGGSYLLIGKESDNWQMFVHEEDEAKKDLK